MKKLSRLLAVLLAVLLLASLGSSAFAANVTINMHQDDQATHTFEAYQIFTGKVSDGKLVDVNWGDGVDATTLIEAVKGEFSGREDIAYVVQEALKDPDTKETKLAELTANSDQNYGTHVEFDENTTIGAIFTALIPNATAEQLQHAFFDGWGQQDGETEIGKKLAYFLGTHPTVLQTTSKKTATGKGRASFTGGLDTGYYFIRETTEFGEGNEYGASSRFLLSVVGQDIEITAKSSVPSVEKKVMEPDYQANDLSSVGKDGTGKGVDVGTGYNDVADYNIGDHIPFEFFGTVPEKYEDYTEYYYKFTDTMADSLDLDTDSVKVFYTNEKVPTGNSVTEWKSIDKGNYTVSNDPANHKFTVEFSIEGEHKGLKDIEGINKNSVIKVTYTATLNDKAVIGQDGQINKVDLTFSNNPYDNGTGKTPEDEVIVFTYELDATKYKNFVSPGNKLEGASFVLTKLENSDTYYFTNIDDARWIKFSTDVEVPAGSTKEQIEEIYRNKGAHIFTSDGNGVICKVKGLDHGDYTLVEIAPPVGYTKASDTNITITSTKNMSQNWDGVPDNALTGFKYKINTNDENQSVRDCIAKADIINMQGTVLPTTGGMGTTLFYVCGAMLVLAAAVLLIARRRMDAE